MVGHQPLGGMSQMIQTVKLFNSMLQISFPNKKIVMVMGNNDFNPSYTGLKSQILSFFLNFQQISHLKLN